jgi:1-acyl-sn-glycerol-3-phosphate acyltransferase
MTGYGISDPLGRAEPARWRSLEDFWREPGVLVRGVRSLAGGVIRALLHVYVRLTIVGRQNLPADRSFILVANHASHLDALCLLGALPIRQRHRTFPVAASEYFCVNRLLFFLAKLIVNVLPFDRQCACWYSLGVCAQLLHEKPGTILILFPEGTRTGGVEPGDFKPGVGFLAAGRDIPVVPCHLAGTHAALARGAWFPRPKAVRLTIGAPLAYAHLPATKASRMRICRELREAVMSLGHVGLQDCLGPRELSKSIAKKAVVYHASGNHLQTDS